MSNIKTITDESRDVFKQLGLEKYDNLGLAASALNGIPVDVIVATDEFGGYPVAILVTDDIFPMLANPVEDIEFDDAVSKGTVEMNAGKF